MLLSISLLIIVTLAAIRTAVGHPHFDYFGEGARPLLSDELAWSKFGNFKSMHNIAYRTADEERIAYERYRDNLIKVEQHNMRYKAGLETYEMYADYPWAAMTEEEFQKRWTGYHSEKKYDGKFEIHRPTYDQMVSIPAEKDWRKESNCINPIKTQGCGNCYAYSAVGALEPAVCIQLHGGKVATRNISEQMFTDCSEGYGCGGGWMSTCYDYAMQSGRCDAMDDYPDVGYDSNCPADAKTKPPICRIETYVQVGHSLPALLEAVANVGPVTVAVWVDAKFFDYRGCEVFQDATEFASVNHGVVVVGYTKNALIIRNSWGAGWGCDGYMYMERETTSKNRGVFDYEVLYPVVY